MTMSRYSIGKLKSSKVVDVSYSTSDQATGFKGKIYAVNFANSYETGNSYERIVVVEEGGRFRMSGFFGVPAP